MAVAINWICRINWIPVEERLPDVEKHEAVTYVTYKDPVRDERYVTDLVGFFDGRWVERNKIDVFEDENAFENKKRQVIAWSKDTVDILPY